MFFILSKTVAVLLMPLTLVVIFLFLFVFVRSQKWKKVFFWIGFGLLLVFTNDIIANELMNWWELPATAYQETKPRKLGIVLTGTTMAKEDPDDRVYFNKGADRVTHTIQLYKLNLIEKILISGGTGRLVGEDEPEADKYRKAMIMMGVDSADIIIENETRNTYESAVAVKPMLSELNYSYDDCLLITSAFHMRRSLACYRKAGVNIAYFTTDFYTHPRVYYVDSYIFPRIEALVIWQKLFKEWIGFAAYKVAGYV
jgi:uncharacterized SAM-binding protein YcdF (DUF218 family)